MKKLLLTLLFALFSLNITSVFASDLGVIDYELKIGSGPKKGTNPNGTKACLFKYSVPKLAPDDANNLDNWLSRGGGHYVAAFAGPNLPPSEMFNLEFLAASVRPGRSDDPASVESRECAKTLAFLNEQFGTTEESWFVVHYYCPRKIVGRSGGALFLGGMQGVNLTILTEASRMAAAGHSSFVVDFLGNRGNPTKDSLAGMGVKTNIAMSILQNLPGVDSAKTVVIANSFGTTAATTAMMPEILEISPPFCLPTHMVLSDPFANMLTKDWRHAPFFAIDRTYIWGNDDTMVNRASYEAGLSAAAGTGATVTHLDHPGAHDAHMMVADTDGQEGESHTVDTILAFGNLTFHVTPSRADVRAACAALAALAGDFSEAAFGPIFEMLTGTVPAHIVHAFQQIVLEQGNPRKMKTLAKMMGMETKGADAPAIQAFLEEYVVKEDLVVNHGQASDLQSLLKKGVTFGPTSPADAAALRKQRHDLAISAFVPGA